MKYDFYNRADPEIIYLAKPGKRLHCALNGVDMNTVSLSENGDDLFKLSFDVYSKVDENDSNGYEYITRQMELYVNGIWFKIKEEPVIDHDGRKEVKHVNAESLETELAQYNLNGFKINQGTEDSWEVINHNSDDDPYQIKFYNEEHPSFSLLHLILKHADVPDWNIGYIDYITPNPDYPEITLPNEIYGFDIDDKDVYSFLTQDVAKAYSCIFTFDTDKMLINAYRVEAIGKDTNIFIGFRNIQNSVSISSNRDLYTVFNVAGDDDLNIDYVNFGSSDIEDITNFLTEPFLSNEIIEKYKAWLEYRETQRQPYIEASKEYNQLVKDIEEVTYRVPTDAVNNDWSEMSTEDLQVAYDDYTVIVGAFEENYVDDYGDFDLDALKTSPDWDLYESIMNYILPNIISILQNREVTIESYGTGNLLSNVNPVITDGWLKINSESSITSVVLDDTPCYGVTHGIQCSLDKSGSYGIFQNEIDVTSAIKHTDSAYVKSNTNSTLKIGFRYSGDSDWNYSGTIFNLPENTWIRVFYTFTFEHSNVDICYKITSANENSKCIIAGMQLEIGSAVTSFGFSVVSEDVINAWETDWKLYGTQELSIKLLSYQDQRDLLSSQGFGEPWFEMSDFEQDYHNIMYQQYLDYGNLCEKCQNAKNIRMTELDILTERQSIIQTLRLEITNNVSKENYGFSECELARIKKLYKKNTYKNENIVTTDFDTISNIVDKQYQLYIKAVEQLYMESHPQYHYEDSADNIFALPEFKEFHSQMKLFNYIHLGIRDDYCVKLRLLGIEYNPCTWDNSSFTIRFSDMLRYQNKRNDFTSLLDNAISSAKSSISSGNSSNKVTSYTFSVDMIKALFSNSAFKTSLSSTINAQTGKFDSAYIKNLSAYSVVAKIAIADEGVFEKLMADSGFMKYLSVNYANISNLDVINANIETLLADYAQINNLDVKIANIETLLAGNAGIGNAQIINLTADNVRIDEAVIKNMIAKHITVADLQAHTASANVIVLVNGENGLPSIAFAGNTQQFYDDEGNVRVQIGQDVSGKFSMIIRNENGDEIFGHGGITEAGIADGLIKNDMLSDNSISEGKLNFQIIKPNEYGGIDIHQVYDGEGNLYGEKITSFMDAITEQIDDFSEKTTETMIGISSILDANTKAIEDKIWQSDVITITDKDGNSVEKTLKDILVQSTTDISGFNQSVSELSTTIGNPDDKPTGISLYSKITQAQQTADKIDWLIKSGTSETNFTLTDRLAELTAQYINLNSLVTFSGLDTNAQNKIETALNDASSANSKIDNLEIGGTNLLLNTGSVLAYSANKCNWTFGNQNSVFTKEINSTDDSYHYVTVASAGNVNNGVQSTISGILFKVGDTYTFSCDVRGEYNDSYPFGAKIFYTDTTSGYQWTSTGATSWKGKIKKDTFSRCSFTFTLPANFDESVNRVFVNIYCQEMDIYVKRFKLGKGTVNTDWSPAPEDVTIYTDAAIDGIEISARNLVRNSSFKNGNTDYWTKRSSVCSFGTDATHGTYLAFYTTSPGDNDMYRIYQSPMHVSGQTYTLTFWAKASAATGFKGGHTVSLTSFSATTEWKKYTVTYTSTSSGSVTFQIDTANVTLYLAKIMLVKGTKASDHMEAPEDITAYTDSAVGGIEVGGRNIIKDSSFKTLNTSVYSTRNSYATLSVDSTNKHNNNNSLKVVANVAGISGTDLAFNTMKPDRSGNYNVRISFYAKSLADDNKFYFRWGFGSFVDPVTLTPEWEKYEIQLNATPSHGCNLHPYFSLLTTVWISELMVEYGTITSDWVPAPEDVESAIESAKNFIVDLSNEFHAVPTDVSGNNGVFTGCATKVTAYFGNTDISTITGVSYTYTSSGVTVTQSSDKRTYTVTAISADSGYVDITATYGSLSSTKRFTVVKNKQGLTGTTGATGTAARIYILETDTELVKKDISNILTPSTLTFKSYYMDGNSTTKTAFTCKLVISESVNGTTFTDKTTVASGSSISHSISSASVTHIKCTLYSGTTVLSIKTVMVVTDSDAITAQWCHANDKTMIDGSKLYAGTVIASALAANAVTAEKIKSYEITADKLNIGLNPNLMMYGYDTFEQVSSVPYVSKASAATAVLDTSQCYYGTKSLKIQGTSSDNYVYLGTSTYNYGCIPITSGKIYRVSCYVRNTSTTTATVQMYVVGHTAINSTNSAHNSTTSTITNSEGWKRVSFTYTALSTYPYISIRLDVDTANVPVWFDAIQIEEVSSSTQVASPFKPAATTVINGGSILTNTITTDKITTNNLVGTNGWINLAQGTFNYGGGKLIWNGSELTVDGKITAGDDSVIGGWTISNNCLSSSVNTPMEIAWSGIDSSKTIIELNPKSVEYVYNPGTGEIAEDNYDKIVYPVFRIYNKLTHTGGSIVETDNFRINGDGSFVMAKGALTYNSSNELKLTGDITATSITAKKEYKIYVNGDAYSSGSNETIISFEYGDHAVTGVGQLGSTDSTLKFGFTQKVNNLSEPHIQLTKNCSGLGSMQILNYGGITLESDYTTVSGSLTVVDEIATMHHIKMSKNNKSFYGTNTSGTNIRMLLLNTNDNIIIGNNDTNFNNLHLYTASGNQMNFYHGSEIALSIRSDTTSTYVRSDVTYNRIYSNSANMYITSNGVFGRYSSSSARYKHDFKSLLVDDVKALYDLPVYTFKYNEDYLADDDERYMKDIIGFKAEDWEEIMPIAVNHLEDGSPEMWNSHIVIPSLLKLIQDLNNRVSSLEKENQELKN